MLWLVNELAYQLQDISGDHPTASYRTLREFLFTLLDQFVNKYPNLEGYQRWFIIFSSCHMFLIGFRSGLEWVIVGP